MKDQFIKLFIHQKKINLIKMKTTKSYIRIN